MTDKELKEYIDDELYKYSVIVYSSLCEVMFGIVRQKPVNCSKIWDERVKTVRRVLAQETELEQLQNKMNRKSEETDWAVYDVVADCAKMLQNGCDKRAIRGYMEMAVKFYGKEQIAATIEDNGFTELKEFI